MLQLSSNLYVPLMSMCTNADVIGLQNCALHGTPKQRRICQVTRSHTVLSTTFNSYVGICICTGNKKLVSETT